jgi:hypothetical protein
MNRTNAPANFLTWPYQDNTATRDNDSKWAITRPPKRTPRLRPPLSSREARSLRALAVLGDRHEALRALAARYSAAVDFAYVDAPRSRLLDCVDESAELTWLSLIDSILRQTKLLISQRGVVAVHAEDRDSPWVRVLLEDIFGPEQHVATIAWQKKYAPQNDLRGKIDDAHDFIFLFGCKTGDPIVDCWAHTFAGKTEDATREVEALRDERIVTLPEIPKTGKPEQLIRRLLERFASHGGIVLEVFSETGFASAAAAKAGHTPILLAGNSSWERDCFRKCGKPRIKQALKIAGFKSRDLIIREVDAGQFQAAVCRNRNEPIALAGVERVLDQSCDLRPILIDGRCDSIGSPPLVCEDDSTIALKATRPVCGSRAGLVWWNTNPITALLLRHPEQIAALHKRLLAAMKLVSPKGYLAIAASDGALAYTRILGELAFGRAQHSGTIVQSDATAPNFITLWRPLPADGSKLGFPVNYTYTDDGHPDGPWRDPGHKGARSGGLSLAYPVNAPPYRWELTAGRLPPGCFRINPETGVIYASRLTQAGRFEFTVAVSDSSGRSARATCKIDVRSTGNTQPESAVWFLDRAPVPSARRPRIVRRALPPGRVGSPYSAVLQATGGAPLLKTLLPGNATADGNRTRYWELSRTTLIDAILQDKVSFGATGSSNPSRKKFAREEQSGRRNVAVELGWWDTARLQGETALSRMARMVSPNSALIATIGGPFPDLRLPRQRLHFGTGPTAGVPIHIRGTVGPVLAHATGRPYEFTLSYSHTDFVEGFLWLEGFLSTRNVTNSRIPSSLSLPSGCSLRGISPDGSVGCIWIDPETWPTTSLIRAIDVLRSTAFESAIIYHFRGRVARAPTGIEFRRIPFDAKCRTQRI